MRKKIVIVISSLFALIAILLILAAFQPAAFRVERSASIAATPAALFEQVNDHRKFQVWNPWAKMDPEAKTTYSGPDAGVGAVASWDGKKIGAGSATITESKPAQLVRQRMDWLKPMEGTSTVDFTFKPDGDKTIITWAMYGENNFMGKLVSLFMDCEKMCGPEFEKGLAELEKIVTSQNQSPATNQP
jgi:hypothetical protein